MCSENKTLISCAVLFSHRQIVGFHMRRLIFVKKQFEVDRSEVSQLI